MRDTPSYPLGPGSLWTPLVQRVAVGDPEAVRELYVSLSGLKTCLQRQLGADDAEDEFHDVILSLATQIQKGALADPERLLGYAHGIVRRKIATRIRVKIRARRCRGVEDVELIDPGTDAETALSRVEMRLIARRILDALPAQHRDVLVRYYLLEQNPDDIQLELGVTAKQFRVIKHRAKARFVKLCQAAMGHNGRMQARSEHRYQATPRCLALKAG
jgi:RNA polymerase sigma-70 factor, ECF subfamily